jgi:hypothetical protein
MNQKQKIIETLVKHAGAWVGIDKLRPDRYAQRRGEDRVRYEVHYLKIQGHNIEHRKNPVSGNSEYRVDGKAVQV